MTSNPRLGCSCDTKGKLAIHTGVFVGILGMWYTCIVVKGGGVLWGIVVLGDSESGRQENDTFEKLPVWEYEQVTCWFRVGLLDFQAMEI